jgi:hypothetical protein
MLLAVPWLLVLYHPGVASMRRWRFIREVGPAWIDGQGAFEQPGVNDHAAFMNALADEGLVLFAGPLAGSERGRIRVLVISDAASEDEMGRHLADNPWNAPSGS